MPASQPPVAAGSAAVTLEERLERGEVLYYPICPFSLPQGNDRQFLLEQELASRAHKNIGHDPHTGTTSGFRHRSEVENKRLQDMFAVFSRSVTSWLARTLPRYARAWKLDRISFRPIEESTRKLRLTARNDLLHVDAFPSRPTNGWRILRVFANVNPVQPRIWVTSEPFAKLFERYGKEVGLPTGQGFGVFWKLGQEMLHLFRPGRPRRSLYDAFMLRFHNFLKSNRDFQENGFKRHWTFPPECAWLAMTDTCSHAALRGRFALEHSFFIAPKSLALPNESPAALLERASGIPVLNRAA
jgi:hypothetical protein